MRPSRLGPFQREVLEAFFRKEKRFFFTGGAALAGFRLGHRDTDDLDLFVTEDDAAIPGDATVAELRDYLRDLIDRLSRLALPGQRSRPQS